jgi:hypothetical protein
MADSVALLTTPFFGSNKMLLKALHWHSEDLVNIHDNFMSSYPEERCLTFSCYETKDTLFLGFLPIGLVRVFRPLLLISAYIGQVVKPSSAKIPSLKRHGRNIAIHKDHSGLNKCESREDPSYVEISRAVGQVMGKHIGSECPTF